MGPILKYDNKKNSIGNWSNKLCRYAGSAPLHAKGYVLLIDALLS